MITELVLIAVISVTYKHISRWNSGCTTFGTNSSLKKDIGMSKKVGLKKNLGSNGFLAESASNRLTLHTFISLVLSLTSAPSENDFTNINKIWNNSVS